MYKTDKDLGDYSYKKIDSLEEKSILIRSCLNVAVDDEGRMTDPTRFYEALPLIKELAGKVKTLIITAHLGRPESREKKSSFWHVAQVLNEELKKDNSDLVVELVEELDEKSMDQIRNNSDKNRIFFIDNIRFFKGEESKDLSERKEFAKKLASMADVFINDAFPDYREAASTYDVAEILPSYLGPVFLKEAEALKVFSNPKKPFIAILGGAKLSEKLDALNALGNIADRIIIGGAMAYTLLKAQGISVGKSLVEEDKLEVAKEILIKFGEKLVLPMDHMITAKFDKEADFSYTENVEIPDGSIAIDIGKKSIENYKEIIRSAASILWNGPMGVFEWVHSALGTLEVGKSIEANTNAYKLSGGGDSIAAINKLGLKGFNHISTGGGAMLSFIAYDKFPVLDVILK
jgi:phosphoglycerate kinase